MKRFAGLALLTLGGALPPVLLAVLVAGSVGGAVAVAVLAGLVLVFAIWSEAILHRVFDVRIVQSGTAPELVILVKRMAADAGLPRPRVGLFESPQANAFATCSRPSGPGTLVFSRALLRDLTREEAEAIVALLLAQLRAPNIQGAQIAATLGGMVSILPSGALWRGGGKPDTMPGAIGQTLAMANVPYTALAMRGVAAGSQPFEVDRDAAALLGNPLSLARALTRLDALAQATENITVIRHPATAHLFAVDPLHPGRVEGLVFVRPPVVDRVDHLKQIAGVGVA